MWRLKAGYGDFGSGTSSVVKRLNTVRGRVRVGHMLTEREWNHAYGLVLLVNIKAPHSAATPQGAAPHSVHDSPTHLTETEQRTTADMHSTLKALQREYSAIL
ncbi:hypothetical protein I3843_15G092900 [Carya illinoinensis]|nr:hypothetical protein I3843_15G092900 [Carya illinoinensis]